MNEITLDDVKRVGYNVRIPINDIRTKKPEEIIDILLKMMPPLFENSQQVFEKIIDMVYDAELNNWRLV